MMETVGHPRAVNALRRGLEEGRLSHAYLIAGPAHVGKMTLAMDLARMVNCAADAPPCGECRHCERIRQGLHADVRVVGPGYGGDEAAQSKSSIGIGEVRALGREANLKPFEGGTRVFIVEDAERLTPEAANALLKTLEEPPDQVVLALLASEPSVLPPTVLSRCRQIALRPMPVEQVAQELRSRNGADAMRIEEIARLSGGRMGWALRAVQEPDLVDGRTKRLQEVQEVLEGTLERRFKYAARLASRFANDQESVVEELDLWRSWLRDVFLLREGREDLIISLSTMDALRSAASALSAAQVADAVHAVEETLGYLRRNVNPRLALERLMLRLPLP